MSESEFTLAGHALETPLINAAGSINGTNPEQLLHEVATLAQTAIGAITIGSFTVLQQNGNEKPGWPAFYYDEETDTTYNSMGLPNIGLQAARRLMPDLVAIAHDAEFPKPVIASISPALAPKEEGDSIDQVLRLAYHLQLAGADLIEVNTSCPNVVSDKGKRKPMLGYDLAGMHELVRRLENWVEPGTVGVKLPPYLTEKDRKIVPELATLFNKSGLFKFVITSNTIPHQIPIGKDGKPKTRKDGKPLLPVRDGKGGMSGPSTAEVGREQLVMWSEKLNDEIEKVSALGIKNGKELALRRKLGAVAGEGVTFIWTGGPWGRTVSKTIDEWYEAEQTE